MVDVLSLRPGTKTGIGPAGWCSSTCHGPVRVPVAQTAHMELVERFRDHARRTTFGTAQSNLESFGVARSGTTTPMANPRAELEPHTWQIVGSGER